MDSPYRGHGDYGSEDQDEHRHSRHSHRPPPPPPRPEDDDGECGYGERREEEEEEGREGGHWGGGRRHGRRRGDDEEERFGRQGDEEGYPPERPPHFPPMGGLGFHRPSHHEGPPQADVYSQYDDGFPQHDAPPHSFTHSGSHHSQRPSDEYTYADPSPSDEYSHVDPCPAKEEPVVDTHLTSQMDSLSLDLPQGRLVRIFCKENSGFNLAVEHNTVVLQQSNSEDEAQQWIKDASHGMRIKDSYGYPAFSLVNKKTKKVLKHANEMGQQVLLVDYQADMKDDYILWTESQDFGEGFKTVRSASDTLLNLTVFEGNKRIRNGSALVLDTWHKGDHQQWKLLPL
eukprot:c24230_g1_i2 orf=466-1494(-)